MLPSLSDVLELPVLRRARPRIIVGAEHVNSPVRWVHIAEVTDLAHLLRGGELVLTTGIAMPDDPAALRRYVADLADVGVIGIAVELGRKYHSALPQALVTAAAEAHLPVITLEREARFVEITEAVHSRIISEQMTELQESERLHRVFTELSVEGAPPERVLRTVAELSGCPVILENLTHQVLVCESAGEDPRSLLAAWETRSRGIRVSARTTHDAGTGWLVTMVGARGQDWGRLILVCGAQPSPTQTMLVERAATTLALGRLLERHQESLERQTHRTIITGIIDRAYADPEEALVRARAVGVPLSGRPLVGMVIRIREADTGLAAQARLADTAEAAARSCRELRLAALVGSLDDGRVGILLALPTTPDVDTVLTQLAHRIRQHARSDGSPSSPGAPNDTPGTTVIGVGSTTESIRTVRRSFLEARQVADVALSQRDERAFHRLPDLHVRGLVHLFRDDERLQTYVERELGPLLSHDARHGTDLTTMLRHYLDCGRNKAVAATHAHLSRPAFYDRLRRIQHVLDADLDSVETCLSLHIALLALDAMREEGSQPHSRETLATEAPPSRGREN
ncbi:PucR family transcriptional regulator ligand-binding domain-containing protein [Lipingzhangella sp. LS1_29]|uniref:PucR family transcriptional regulator ligand-binding domain-containing protein n=1 Tax=Lipingzhangella rawalii TaxID=2055835 RepID=A0ABU2H5N3_9ACTN|nr:PucR family transcriptional regulator ligand-binding domain-containing protein [Lipingzhangella rawalii]MDS1270608.1 PucR family transcriptional regulator ligand-binding domain-containing protein [Lipingzhangella rawalii]